MSRTSILAAAALFLTGCASTSEQAGAPAARDCFRANTARGFEVIDERHIAVNVGAARRYILTTAWDVHAIDFSQAIALRSATGSICVGNGLGVEVIGGDPQQRYNVTSIERAPDRAPQGT
jgi:hypothetical protein